MGRTSIESPSTSFAYLVLYSPVTTYSNLTAVVGLIRHSTTLLILLLCRVCARCVKHA